MKGLYGIVEEKEFIGVLKGGWSRRLPGGGEVSLKRQGDLEGGKV